MNETPISSPQDASVPNGQPAQPPQTVRVLMPPIRPNVTYAILGFTVFVYLMQLLSTMIFGYAGNQIDWLEVYGARFNEAIRAGELWRFITPVFLHGSVMHIFFNMYALYSIGSFLERQFGHWRFTLLYFLAGFSGNVFSFFFTGDNGYSIGASTAVFGLVAAEVVFFYQNRAIFGRFARQAIGNAVFIIVANLLLGLAPGIDNWGHVGGLMGGAIFAWFAGPLWKLAGTSPDFKLEDEREVREIAIGTILVVIIFGLQAVLGMNTK